MEYASEVKLKLTQRSLFSGMKLAYRADCTRGIFCVAQVGAGRAKFAVVERVVESGVGGVISNVSPSRARIACHLARRSHVLANPLRLGKVGSEGGVTN